MRLGVAASLVEGTVLPGDVSVEEGLVSGLGLSPAGSTGLATPGFVDVQVNGVAGVDFLSADTAGYARASEALARTGVTAFQPTFVSSPVEVAGEAIVTLSTLDGPLPGAQVLPAPLEGPFISPLHHGAHNPRHLLAASTEVADALCALGPVGYVTLAPEIEGGLALVEHLVARGLVVSLGHSDARADDATAAFDRGARAVTHVFNAMRAWAPRDPGLAGVALSRPDVFVAAIVDFVHLARETVRLLLTTAGDRLVLISDAIEAAGLGDGTYHPGGREVVVRAGGAARRRHPGGERGGHRPGGPEPGLGRSRPRAGGGSGDPRAGAAAPAIGPRRAEDGGPRRHRGPRRLPRGDAHAGRRQGGIRGVTRRQIDG